MKAPVDYINPHATSTPVGDIPEINAIHEVFGDKTPPISATKSLTGHSQGAAGVHEAIYTLLMMQNDFICESANIVELDPGVEGANIVRQRIDNANINRPVEQLRLRRHQCLAGLPALRRSDVPAMKQDNPRERRSWLTPKSGLMAGKRGLVMGVANDHSIAWGIAQMLAPQGAEIAFTYQGERQTKRLRPLAASLGSRSCCRPMWKATRARCRLRHAEEANGARSISWSMPSPFPTATN